MSGIPPFWEPIRARPGYEYKSNDDNTVHTNGWLKRSSDGAIIHYFTFLHKLANAIGSSNINTVYDYANSLTAQQWDAFFQEELERETINKLERL